jgi:hypothetical protein
MDAFIKYALVTAVETKEAETTAKVISSEWFCKFGMPAQIHTNAWKSLLTNFLKNFLIH